MATDGSAGVPGDGLVRFGEYELDLRRFELRQRGSAVHLEPRVFDVLAHLVAHRDRVVSKHELLDEVWGDRFVGESALTSSVLFAASASFREDIAQAGHSSVPAGRDWLTSTMASTFPEMLSRPPGPNRQAWAREIVFASETARASLPHIMTIARDWKADLVVREAAEYGGCLAAELLDIPHAVVRTDSGSSSYADRHHVAASLDAIRSHVGLPPDPDAVMAFRYLSISFAPRCLDGPDQETASTTHHLRPCGPDDAGHEAHARSLATFPDQPTVYSTLGTVYSQPEQLSGIVRALVTEPVNLIMTVGPSLDPTMFDPFLSNVRVERWIPQHHVLPRCDVVVTHGGYRTVTAALTHGCPLVLLPISADQPYNAARCSAAGVGITIGAERAITRSHPRRDRPGPRQPSVPTRCPGRRSRDVRATPTGSRARPTRNAGT